MRTAMRPDAQAFDEVRLVTVPRFKTSGLSGDEWRISGEIQLYRKGKLIETRAVKNIEMAMAFAPSVYYGACDDGKAFFAGEEGTCDQEGCGEPATVFYRMKKEFCRSGHESDPYEFNKEPLVRKFCEKHSHRGDCGLDDADVNYEPIPLE